MIQNKPNIRAHRPTSPLSGSMYRTQENHRTRAVFEALARKLSDLGAFEKQVIWTHTDFRWMKWETGIGMNEITETLEPFSVSVSQGYVDEDDYFPEDHYYRVPDAGITWQKFGKHFEIIVNDHERLRGFINAQRGLQYSIYPYEVQEYGDLTFNFTLDQIEKNGKVIKNLGEKSSKLAKVLLENRNCRFSYAELSKITGEERAMENYQTKYSCCRSLDKIFERLNRECGVRIFHYKNDSVLIIEPCRSDVGDV